MMGIKSFKEYVDNKRGFKWWHITTQDSLDSISKEGFKAQNTDKGNGLSISVNPQAALALMKTIERMNSFHNEQEVVDWYANHGVSQQDINNALTSFKRWYANEEKIPQKLYLRMQTMFHPAAGGTANIPFNEFLWNDIAKKFIGKNPVLIEGDWPDEVPKHTANFGVDPSQFGKDSIEAEMFVPESHVGHLNQYKNIYRSSEEFEKTLGNQ